MWKQSARVSSRSSRPIWRSKQRKRELTGQRSQSRSLSLKKARLVKRLLPWGFLLPSLCGTLVFVIFPFLDVIRRSFADVMGKRFTGIENYKLVLENEAFRRAAWNTARFTLICVPLLLLVSFFLAVLVHGVGKTAARELMKTAFLVPMAVPAASVVFLWQILFQDQGLLNRILVELNKTPASFLNSGKAFWVLVFTYVWKNTGYDMVLWLAGLSGIPDSLYEAAKIDGAGRWACFRYVTLPELADIGGLVAVLSLVNSFKAFREAYLIAGSYPHESIYLLWHLFHNWFLNLDTTKLYAGAVLMTLVIAVFLGFFSRRQKL